MDEAAFRDLIAGRPGLSSSLLRTGLRGLSWIYGAGVRVRNMAFDRGWARIARAAVPVISLGNITAGGTGKTPFAAFLAGWFRARGIRVAFVSRGYRAEPGRVNDEALVLDQLCPDVPHLQNPHRAAAARIAVEKHDTQLIILDDAFQHRRLARDLDIVLIDALNPWGYGYLLPRGLLREPLRGLRRADLVVITRVDQVAPEVVSQIQSRLRQFRPGGAEIEAAFAPRQLRNAAGTTDSWSTLAGQPLAAFCGIGNPVAFQRTLAALSLPVEGTRFRAFSDHHPYSPDDVASLARWAEETGVAAVLTTQKDLVKIPRTHLGSIPLWAVEIGVELRSGQTAWEAALQRICPG